MLLMNWFLFYEGFKYIVKFMDIMNYDNNKVLLFVFGILLLMSFYLYDINIKDN